MPAAYSPPTMAPMLVPTMQSMGMCSCSMASITPTWAAPRAPPPLSTRQTLGRTGFIAAWAWVSAARTAGLPASSVSRSALVRIARIWRPCGIRAFYRSALAGCSALLHRHCQMRRPPRGGLPQPLVSIWLLGGVSQTESTRADVDASNGAHHRQQGLHLVGMGHLHELLVTGEALHVLRVAGVAHAHHLGEQALLDGSAGHLEQLLHGAIETAHRGDRIGLAPVSLEDGLDVEHGAHLVLEPADAVIALLVGAGAD